MVEGVAKRIMRVAVPVLTIIITACAVWLGVYIGRVVEHRRMQELVARQVQEVANIDIKEYAREIAAMESYMAGNDKLLQTIAAMRNYYVDSIKLEDIYEKAIPALLSELDPHSEYIPAKDFSKVNESLEPLLI